MVRPAGGLRLAALTAWLALTACGLACASSSAPPLQEAGGAPQFEALSADAIERHVRYLASDELEGRMTGTPGAMEAARYQAEVLRSAGVQPGGDGDTFFQSVPLRELVYEQQPRITALLQGGAAQPMVYGVEFYGLSGPVPDGRLQVTLVRSKEDVPAELGPEVALFVDGNVRERNEWLAGVGDFGLEIRPGSSRPGRERSDLPRGARWVAGKSAPRAAISVRGPFVDLFRSGEVESVVVTSGARIEELESANVVGFLPGEGPLASEVVVFTAHYDHIGTRPHEQPKEPEESSGEGPEEGPEEDPGEAGSDAPDEDGNPSAPDASREPPEPYDTVFNGADDDASGCAAVLELARAFGALEQPPQRTLVFLLVTGEEIGLLGTKHYLDQPLRPLADTVCNLNFEMIGRPDELVGGVGKLWLTGDERSNLGEAWRLAGIDVVPDPRPDQSFFTRSDNYAFAVIGIVAQTLSTYNLHGDYHRVSDEADRLDFEHMEAVVRIAFEAARSLADGSVTPAWNPGGDPSQR